MRPYFEGWYFRHHHTDHTLCAIPGMHRSRAGGQAFIQLITREASYHVPFDLSQYSARPEHAHVCIGNNYFDDTGMELHLDYQGLKVDGELSYRGIQPLSHDIMGPFAHLPMQCKHGVYSMRHDLSGTLTFNGTPMCFDGGCGYVETDAGRSFPRAYAWTQCNAFSSPSAVMAAVAHIPMPGFSFWGMLCAVTLGTREIVMATYNGGKIVQWLDDKLVLRRGGLELTVEVLGGEAKPLRAPQNGQMSRVIHERAACTARYVLKELDKVLLDETSDGAAFESVVPGRSVDSKFAVAP